MPMTNVRVSLELREFLDKKAKELDTSMAAIVEESVREKFSSGTGTSMLRFLRPANRNWHEMLDRILASGRADAIRAVQENLKVFDAYAKTQRKQSD